MADLSFGDVLIIGGVGTIGFTLISYWFSGVMSRRGWSWQVRKAPKKRKAVNAARDATAAGSPTPATQSSAGPRNARGSKR